MNDTDQRPYETVVRVNYHMPTDFRAQLNTKADAFEASFGAATTAMDERVAAHAEVIDEINQGARAVRNSPPARGGVDAFRGRGGGSDGIIRNKYHGNSAN
jgi:hypothetical protein